VTTPVDAAARAVASMGVPLPDNLDELIGKLINPWVTEDVNARTHPDRLIAAWRATRNAQADEAVWIVLLMAFREEFAVKSDDLIAAIKATRMSPFGTRVEVDRQLGSRAFHLGRRLIEADPRSGPGRALLQLCVRILRGAVNRDERATDATLRMMHGQIATASLHLARAATPEETARDLDVALIHSRLAESHGDTTADHFGYQAEMLLRQFQNNRDGALLDEAGRTLRNIGGEPTVPALAASAELAFNWAVFEIERHKLAAALQFLLQAHAEYSRSLDLDQSSGVHAGYLLAKRGRASLMLYRLGVDPSGRHDSAFLERAIEDWLDPRAIPHRHDYEAAEALLNRARLRRGREDHVGAQADSALAVKYLVDAERPLTAEKLRADQLDADLQLAERARDIDRTLTLLTGVPALPWNSPIPAAALANGCKLLVRSLPEARWRPVVAAVLDRVEADIDHPALTAAARSHVAGHAANLARILTRSSDAPDEFRRSIALYRRAIGEGDDAAAKTLERAGAIAFELAELLASSDNAESEEALGLWTDSMAWSSAALIKAEDGSRPAAFDTARTAHRVGVAALRLFDRTRDPALLEAAQRRLAETPETSHETDTARLLAEASADTAPLATVVVGRVGRRVSTGVTSATANSQLTITPLDTAVQDPRGLDPIAQAWALLDAADTHPADRSDLLLKVATIAANDADFPSSTLGGQRRPGAQGVRIINDRHRLLEQVLVLKRSTREAAEREHHATAEFTRWLEDHHEDDASARWRLPEPLGVVPAEEDEGTYVMRRHAGRTLGSLLVDWRARAGSDPTPKFIQASRFLAAFQSWKVSSEIYRIADAATVFSDLQQRLNRAAQTLQLRSAVATRTADLLAPHFAVDSVLLPKKDAHAGNWIWTHHGELVLIDIESTATLPVLLELATLIDDLPLFGLDDDGWQQRMSAADTYLEELEKHGVDTALDAAAVRSQYEVMCLYLAAVGLGRLSRKDPGTSSRTARATFAQRGHYESMITYLAKHGGSDGVRAAASGWLTAEVGGSRFRAAR
jgi:hypothetical protein